MLNNRDGTNDKPQVKVAASTQGKLNGGTGSKSTAELQGSKARYEKGMELYKAGKVSITGDGKFKVSGYNEVDTAKMKCSCPDYSTRKQPCKHIFACLLFTKNRGKQKIEHLEGNGLNHDSPDKQSSNKPVEAHNKEYDRQATITRLAVINSAIEALKTHRKPVEFNDILSLASQLEKWALSK